MLLLNVATTVKAAGHPDTYSGGTSARTAMEYGPSATVTAPVASAEFFHPSHAAKVNVSVPMKPGSGK